MHCTIKRMGINGEGIGYDGKIPVFVPGAFEGEEVECEIIEDHKKYKIAKLKRIRKKSEFRVPSVCPNEKECGGCSLICMEYTKQLQVKTELLKEALKKYSSIPLSLVEEIVPSAEQFGYRNQCKLPVKRIKGKLESGMYAAGSNFLVGLDECKIHQKELDEIRHQFMAILNEANFRDYNTETKTGIRNIVIRSFHGKHQVTLVTGKDEFFNKTIEQMMAIEGVSSLYQNVNTSRNTVPLFSENWRHLGGNKSLMVNEARLKLKLSAASFFQLNTKQAFKLYQIAEGMIDDCELLVEAYCGVGTMSLMMAKKAKEVIGIEIIPSAVRNANENAKINHIANAKFITGDAAEETTKISKKRKIDVLLIDPPRSGIDDAMLNCIIKSKVKKVVYISCNPATLAKNLNDLSAQYAVEKMIPVDMFPNTPHVETVVCLKRKG